MILAQGMGLNYSTSAGVITLLSIQDTKKETIRVVVLRLCSFGLALAFSAACFFLLGYGPLALGVFLLLFSGVSLAFRMQEGISVNTVLITHFMAEQSMSARNIVNELGILAIGAGIGLILNLYIPGKGKQIRARQREIENRMREILKSMAKLLSTSAQTSQECLEHSILKLNGTLKLGEKHAYEEMENKLLTETRYYLRYMNMRRVQSSVLKRIAEDIGHLQMLPPQSDQIAAFMERICISFHEYNNAVELLEELDCVRVSMRKQALPGTRGEFESRAILYRILLELEQFLEIKKAFVEELTGEEIKKFWKDADSNPQKP